MIDDEMLKRGAAELASAINKSLPDPAECNHQFSYEFEKKIDKLNRRTNHQAIYRTLRSAACILFVMIIGFSVMMAVNVKARDSVFGWIKTQYGLFYEYFFEGEADTSETASYYPGWLPGDCVFMYSYETAGGGEVYIYTDAQDMIVSFGYIPDPEGAKLYMDGVEAERKIVNINGCSGDLYISGDEEVTNNLIWMDDSKMVLFYISAGYDEDTLIKIAENILEK